MRPVNRGSGPRAILKYRDAFPYLQENMGRYCSYCERELKAGLAVEHVQDKDSHPERELDWDNFLLACVNCNSTKSTKETNDSNFLWPDKDNTMLAFDYCHKGKMSVSRSLPAHLLGKANSLVELVGLDRYPGHIRHRAGDQRATQREEAWSLAEELKLDLATQDSPIVRKLIVTTAKEGGFFSVWMSVFGNDPDMKNRLITAFIGTAEECFRTDGSAVTRPNSQHI